MTLIDEFEEGESKYYISEYMETDLLKVAHSRPGHVLQLQQALPFFARIIELLEELHANKLTYRNVRP